jgi:hypothetical protein
VGVLQYMLVDARPVCECDVWTTRAAARAGSLAALQLLQQQGLLGWDNWTAKVRKTSSSIHPQATWHANIVSVHSLCAGSTVPRR